MCHSEESVREAGSSRVNGPLRSPLPLATFQASPFSHWTQSVWGSLGYSQYLLLQTSDPWHLDSAGSSVILHRGSSPSSQGLDGEGRAEAVDGSHTPNCSNYGLLTQGWSSRLGSSFRGPLSSFLGHSLSLELWKETSRYQSLALQNAGVGAMRRLLSFYFSTNASSELVQRINMSEAVSCPISHCSGGSGAPHWKGIDP